MSGQEHPNTARLHSQASEFDALQHAIDQALSRMSKAHLVVVTKVSGVSGVGPVGKVSVSPLVKMQDALGNVHEHVDVTNLSYFRMQGGADKAIIMDPKVGDIGVAIFMDRDSSAAKKNNAGWDGTKSAKYAQAPAGSFRQHDMADGMFFGCVLGGKPKSYIQFQDDGTIVASPDEGVTTVEIKKAKITMSPDSGVTTVIAEPDKLSLNTSVLKSTFTPARIDFGVGGTGVVTAAGTSTKVFAVI